MVVFAICHKYVQYTIGKNAFTTVVFAIDMYSMNWAK